jgi:hypothetical protein
MEKSMRNNFSEYQTTSGYSDTGRLGHTPLALHRALLLQAPLQLDLLTNNLRIEPFQDFDAVPTAPRTSQNVLLDKPLHCAIQLHGCQVPCNTLSGSQPEGNQISNHLLSCVLPPFWLELEGILEHARV